LIGNNLYFDLIDPFLLINYSVIELCFNMNVYYLYTDFQKLGLLKF